MWDPRPKADMTPDERTQQEIREWYYPVVKKQKEYEANETARQKQEQEYRYKRQNDKTGKYKRPGWDYPDKNFSQNFEKWFKKKYEFQKKENRRLDELEMKMYSMKPPEDKLDELFKKNQHKPKWMTPEQEKQLDEHMAMMRMREKDMRGPQGTKPDVDEFFRNAKNASDIYHARERAKGTKPYKKPSQFDIPEKPPADMDDDNMNHPYHKKDPQVTEHYKRLAEEQEDYDESNKKYNYGDGVW